MATIGGPQAAAPGRMTEIQRRLTSAVLYASIAAEGPPQRLNHTEVSHDGDPTAFIGLDTHKNSIAAAIADDGRDGEVRFYGEIANTPEAIGKLAKKLSDKYDCLHFCYEAGPCGYGVHRQLIVLGHQCVVVPPSHVPTKNGNRVKNDRRDAINLARLHRAGELSAIWVPDVGHEAIRDLVRARTRRWRMSVAVVNS